MPQIDQMIAEHDRHSHIVDRLWALTFAEQALTPARWRRLLEIEVREFSAMLNVHFASEEQGGYMRLVVERSSESATLVAFLLEQHQAIRMQFDLLLNRLQAGQAVATSLEQLREVLWILRAHEQGENDLVHEVLHRDISVLG